MGKIEKRKFRIRTKKTNRSEGTTEKDKQIRLEEKECTIAVIYRQGQRIAKFRGPGARSG